MSFLDRVDKALMNGGIVSDPLVENFITLMSEAVQPKVVELLERWMADDPDTSDLPYKLLKREKDDDIVITKFSEHVFQEEDLRAIILVSEAIAKLQLVDLSASASHAKDLIEATYDHASELDNYIENNEEVLDNEKFRQNIVAFYSALAEKSQSEKVRDLATQMRDEIRKAYEEEPDDDEEFSSKEEEEEAIRQWREKHGVAGPEEEEEIRQWLADDEPSAEPEEADEDLLGLDWENAQVGRPPEGGRGDEPPVMEPVKPGEFPPKTPQDIADLMDPDDEPDDTAKALRQKMAAKGFATKTRLEPGEEQPSAEEPPESEPHGLDIKVKEKGEEIPGEDLEAEYEDMIASGREARSRVQVLRMSGDKALVRVKAMKRDKRTGKRFYTYRFVTINQADVGESTDAPDEDRLHPVYIWKYLKKMYNIAASQSDPRYSKQYNKMFSVNLKDAYSSFDTPASNFREHIKNFVGDSPSDRLMRAYARNDPYDRYRLSGVISSIDDRTAARIVGDLRSRMRVDMGHATKWLLAQKRSYEGKEFEEGKEITNEIMLGHALRMLNEAVDKELANQAASALAYNAVVKEILRNPVMLEKYGVEVPEFAKTREKRFKQWWQQEVGKGRVGWGEKEKQTELDLGYGEEVPPERKAQYKAMFGKEPETYEKNIHRKLAKTFSKIVKDPNGLKALKRWANKEAKLGNLGMVEFQAVQELINATVNNTLPEYLSKIREDNEYIFDRINRLVQQVGTHTSEI